LFFSSHMFADFNGGLPITHTPWTTRIRQKSYHPYWRIKKLSNDEFLHWYYPRVIKLHFAGPQVFSMLPALIPDGEIREGSQPGDAFAFDSASSLIAARGKNVQVISILATIFLQDDGTDVRDYIHVEDLAKAHLSAMNHIGSKEKKTMADL